MATKKKVVKAKKPVAKPAAKKPAAKKPVAKPAAKKPVAKKPAPKAKPVAKKPVAKKAALQAKPAAPAKKPAPKKAKVDLAAIEMPAKPVHYVRKLKPGKKTDRSGLNRVAPRINVKKPAPAAKPKAPEPVVDTAAVVAFAQNIAAEMKRAARVQEETVAEENGIRLSRRPTTRAAGGEKFGAADLAMFRKRLIEARTTATSGVSAMKSTGFNDQDDHEADGGDGTNQTLRLQALGQMGTINRTIQQIDEALHRIDEGVYGVCKVCGQLIRKPRLLNQPFVLTCMECQSEMEKNAGR